MSLPSQSRIAAIVKSFDRTQFEQNLQNLETELENFKVRYQQFLADLAIWEQYQALQTGLQEAQAEPTELESTQKALFQEYDRLRQQVEAIEAHWEAQFFSWNGFGTVFWQGVRFAGLGLLLGWWLRGCAA